MKWVKQNKLVTFLALLKFLMPLLILNSVWELHRDEYLYYQQGLHPDFGFLECPPLLGFLGYISSLAGGSVLSIKFWPALFGAFTLLITTATVKQLGGKLFAQFVAGLGIVFSGFMRTHYLFQPNFLDIFFWALSAYYLLRYINSKEDKYLYFLSMSLALGWWSKYSVLFFAAAMVLSILLTKYRRMLITKSFWIATGLGLVLILPNIAWQYAHNFPVIYHMKELRETQLQFINKTDFIVQQLLMLFPVLFVWLAGLFWLLINNRYRIIAFIYLFVLILLMTGSGKGYYSLGAYPMLLAAGGVYLEKISFKRTCIRFATVSVILLLSLPFVLILLPLQQPAAMAAFNQKYNLKKLGILKWEDQEEHSLQQDFADMLGWKELSLKAERHYHSLPPAEQADCVIYCRNYGQAGALKYYGKDQAFLSKVFCDNGTFLLWIPPRFAFKHLIFIGRQMPGKDDEVFNHFGKVTIIDSVTNPLSRQLGDKIIYYQNADSLASKMAIDGLNEMKQQFSR